MLVAVVDANRPVLGLASQGCSEPVPRLNTGSTSHADRIGQVSQSAPLRQSMIKELTEEEMRRALFGYAAEVPTPVNMPGVQEVHPAGMTVPPAKAATKKGGAKAFTPRLRVTLRVGNEFEGETYEIIHNADTLSTLLAEQEATKAARKKFRYVEVISVKSM